MLKINLLTKKYGDKIIINGISLEVTKGGIAIMLGASGVGKSTLLRILNNLETFDSGTISFDGTPLDVSHVNETHVVGMVFQHFNLFGHLNTEQNITLALEKALNKSSKEAHSIAMQQLERFGLKEKAQSPVSRT